MTNEQHERLEKPFKSNEVKWRITATFERDGGLQGVAAPYLDSRAIQKRLDNVIGHGNWQNAFTAQALGKDNAFICTISIYNAERREWISKSNGAGNSNIEPIKGGLSDALKRAASMWGIGRYLYDFGITYVKVDQRKAIVRDEYKRLDKIYDDTVRRLFPNPAANTNPQENHPPQPAQAANVQDAPIKEVPRRLAQNPIFTVVNATLGNGYSILELKDSTNPPFTAYFNGEAKLARNQRITDVVIQTKNGSMGDYYVLETYRIAESFADSENYPQAA
jgi:hypothetical protein